MIGLAIIGTGIFARDTHLPALLATGKYEIVACYNRSKDKAEAFASLVAEKAAKSPRVYDSVEELLADPKVDAVDVLVPVQTNASLISKVLAAGKPVSFEKPIAATLTDAREIVREASETPLPVLCLENWCYLPCTSRLRELIHTIGKPVIFTYQATQPFRKSKYHATTWRQTPEHVGGFLSDSGVHDMGLLTAILGPVASVSARTGQLQKESGADDYLSALLTLESGVSGTYTQGRYLGPTERQLVFQIFGDKGSLRLERGSEAFLIIEENASTGETAKRHEFGLGEFNGVQAEFDNFAEAVSAHDKSKLLVTPESAFNHYAVFIAALESASKGGSVISVEKV